MRRRRCSGSSSGCRWCARRWAPAPRRLTRPRGCAPPRSRASARESSPFASSTAPSACPTRRGRSSRWTPGGSTSPACRRCAAPAPSSSSPPTLLPRPSVWCRSLPLHPPGAAAARSGRRRPCPLPSSSTTSSTSRPPTPRLPPTPPCALCSTNAALETPPPSWLAVSAACGCPGSPAWRRSSSGPSSPRRTSRASLPRSSASSRASPRAPASAQHSWSRASSSQCRTTAPSAASASPPRWTSCPFPWTPSLPSTKSPTVPSSLTQSPRVRCRGCRRVWRTLGRKRTRRSWSTWWR
mmetsp:Transcript_19034/g.73268  ORF Transcript_19034/g.73268 Transcript_19034/m.73268 type:complete len:296 (+) Transcript_19034:956-1843(+)